MSLGEGSGAETRVDLAQAGLRRTGREVSVDWCEASAKHMPVTQAFELLRRLFGKEYGRDGFDVRRDDEARFDAVGPFGIRVQADRVGQVNSKGDREPWLGVRVPGEACRIVGTDAVLDLVEALEWAGKVKVSRLDLALDDYDRSVTPRQFAGTCVAGPLDGENVLLARAAVTRVKPSSWEWSRRHGGCFWLGGRKSARLLRVYDKERESGGAITSVRIELQCRDAFATELTGDLLEARWTKRPLAEVWAEHVVGYVDLRVPKVARSGSASWPRVPWWQRLVGDVKGVAVAQPDAGSLGEWLRAMGKQCGGYLKVLLVACGVDVEQFRAEVPEAQQAERMLEALRLAVPAGPWALSGEQQVRLAQIRSARERGEALAILVGRGRR